MLDSALLRSFMDEFYGYGSHQGPHWFVGMEEGGGNSEEEIARRLSVWNSRGRRELEDLCEFHLAVGITEWHSSSAKIQKTWYPSVRILLILNGVDPNPEIARAYQRDRLARPTSESRLSNLLPLPSPSRADWLYSAWSELPELCDRQGYSRAVMAFRTDHLATSIARHKPRSVVFYGESFMPSWARISGQSFEWRKEGLAVAETPATRFVACQHPRQGVSNEYFDAVGRWLVNS